MNGNFQPLGKGYLYNLWNGTVQEYGGEIYRKEYKCKNGPYVYKEAAFFMVKDKYNRTTKKLQCGKDEGVVYNKSVWFFKPNRKKAIRILLDYEKMCIAELQFKILNHEVLVEQLESSLLREELNGSEGI